MHMGLFFPSKKSTVSSNSSIHPSDQSDSVHRASNQYGSRSGEINHAELRHGIDHDLHHVFHHDTERKTIETMLNMELDNSRRSNRHVIDRREVERIVENVHGIYPQHSEKVRKILEERM